MRERLKKFSRRYVQLISAVLYNCNVKGFASGKIWKENSKGMCAPGLNCYSCPGAVISCPLGSLQSALVSSKYKFPYYILGTLLLMGLFLGRFICGFLCPFGLIQELLHKIPTPKLEKSKFTRGLTLIKYVLLVIFAVMIPVFIGAPGFCKYICPAGTLEAGIPLTIMQEKLRPLIGALFSWKVAMLIVTVTICVFAYRGFCRFLCPLGAIYSFFQPVSFFGVQVDETKCIHCDACIRNCKMDVKKVCDRECIQCGECIQHCPVDAINIGVRKTDKKKKLIWSVVLMAALILIAVGIKNKGFHDVMSKAIRLCYECMGIG
ncbi:MAG: 4Fe-4S binding protein [Butyrivibrio sp.]|nr:4Fe-4S binding protein [Butyrivibrio sp.]